MLTRVNVRLKNSPVQIPLILRITGDSALPEIVVAIWPSLTLFSFRFPASSSPPAVKLGALDLPLACNPGYSLSADFCMIIHISHTFPLSRSDTYIHSGFWPLSVGFETRDGLRSCIILSKWKRISHLRALYVRRIYFLCNIKQSETLENVIPKWESTWMNCNSRFSAVTDAMKYAQIYPAWVTNGQ